MGVSIRLDVSELLRSRGFGPGVVRSISAATLCRTRLDQLIRVLLADVLSLSPRCQGMALGKGWLTCKGQETLRLTWVLSASRSASRSSSRCCLFFSVVGIALVLPV